MQAKMRNANFGRRLKLSAILVCKVVLPLLTFFFVMILSSSSDHPFTQNLPANWLLRLFLLVYFCRSYWGMPDLFEPRPEEQLWVPKTVLMDPILLRAYYLFIALFTTLMAGALTYVVFGVILSFPIGYQVLAVCLNAAIFLGAFAWRYQAFIQLASQQTF